MITQRDRLAVHAKGWLLLVIHVLAEYLLPQGLFTQ